MEVIAIESSDAVGWVECAATLGEVEFNSLASFTNNVLRFVGSAAIHKLHLQAHGNPLGIYFGPHPLTVDNFDKAYDVHLKRLTASFSQGATVVLRACHIGQNRALLMRLASHWRVSVVAGQGLQNNVANFNLGSYVTIDPDGCIETSFVLPTRARYDRFGADERALHRWRNRPR